MGDAGLFGATQKMVDHPAREPLPARSRRHRDLPDEEIVGIRRGAVARDPADHLPVPFGDDAMVGEMRALDEVAIGRRSEERRVGKECVSTCRSRWSPYQSKKKK